ncbi:copper resistance CopC family protein [Arthrobacter sp. H41]|uniref:copper resistance CopC family protein n=1 Tax=Arthrobacter sp. H41 TaxID=1312978 RepID=UPI0004B04262|nr:copper resistance CopC family protein [Arthrobacter sp. H41]
MPSSSSAPVARSTRPAHALRNAAVLLTAMVTMLLSLLTAAPALAHDDLASSNPPAGGTVDVLPATVELMFSEVPSGIGAEVQVLDDAGTDWAEGAPQIVNASAQQAVRPGAPAGEYTVNWRVVSSDSHPIEGSFTFTAASGAAAAPGVATAPGEAAAPDAATTGLPLETAEAESPDTETAGVSDFPWSIIVMIAVLLALAVGLGITARKRLSR